jgi:hypothetical protein
MAYTTRPRYYVSDPAAALRRSWFYLVLSVLIFVFATFIVVWRHDFAYFVVGTFIALLMFLGFPGWRRYARWLESDGHGATLALILGQKGADFDQAKLAVQAEVPFVSERTAIMPNPRTWPQRQRIARFLSEEFDVYLYEGNGRVASIIIWEPRPWMENEVPADSSPD